MATPVTYLSQGEIYQRPVSGKAFTYEDALKDELASRLMIFTWVLAVTPDLKVRGVLESNSPELYFKQGDEFTVEQHKDHVKILRNGKQEGLLREFTVSYGPGNVTTIKAVRLNLDMKVHNPHKVKE